MSDLHLLDSNDVKNFLVAGNATITLESVKTRNKYTYKINKKDDNRGDLWFVKLMLNPNKFEYIGFFKDNLEFKTSSKSKVREDSKSFLAIKFLLNRIDNIPENLNIYHSCKCGRCGRILTNPESIKNGIGHECHKKIKSL